MHFPARLLVPALILAFCCAARADDVLFIGNSFTYGATDAVVVSNGGVPKLFEEIARGKGRQVETEAVTKGGQPWSYHLAQPATAKALAEKPWTWVVLQDHSIRPTRIGDVAGFMHDGETFSERIKAASPRAGILLYETWARPPGDFYKGKGGLGLSSPEEMMEQLHDNYAKLGDELAKTDGDRPARVAQVGTAFARTKVEDPEIVLDAKDAHHATREGYYLAALVIYETIYHDSVKGAPAEFFHGALKFPADEAAKLQTIADEVAGGK